MFFNFSNSLLYYNKSLYNHFIKINYLINIKFITFIINLYSFILYKNLNFIKIIECYY